MDINHDEMANRTILNIPNFKYLFHVYCPKYIIDEHDETSDIPSHSYFVAGDTLEQLVIDWANILFEKSKHESHFHSLCGREVVITVIGDHMQFHNAAIVNAAIVEILRRVDCCYNDNFDAWYKILEDQEEEEHEAKEMAEYKRLHKKYKGKNV